MEKLLIWLNKNRVELVILTIIVTVFLMGRTKPTEADLSEVVNAGEPVVIEVFSNT